VLPWENVQVEIAEHDESTFEMNSCWYSLAN